MRATNKNQWRLRGGGACSGPTHPQPALCNLGLSSAKGTRSPVAQRHARGDGVLSQGALHARPLGSTCRPYYMGRKGRLEKMDSGWKTEIPTSRFPSIGSLTAL
jgi:hypothetical protein